jgi:hypothetical protein
VRVVLFLHQTLHQPVAGPLHGVELPVDQTVHRIDILLQLVVAAVYGGDSVEFMFRPSEDAVCAQQLLLGFAVDRDVAVVFQTSYGVLRSN